MYMARKYYREQCVCLCLIFFRKWRNRLRRQPRKVRRRNDFDDNLIQFNTKYKTNTIQNKYNSIQNKYKLDINRQIIITIYIQ